MGEKKGGSGGRKRKRKKSSRPEMRGKRENPREKES